MAAQARGGAAAPALSPSAMPDGAAHAGPRAAIRLARALAVFGLALGVRALFLLSVRQPAASQLASFAEDSVHYVAMAQRLLAGHGYSFFGGRPDAYVSPGYPLFVAGLMHLFPADPLVAIRWSQAVIGAATAAVAASWGGFLAGVLVALYPPFIWSTASILTEVLFLLLLLGYLTLHARLLTSSWPSRGCAVAAGVLLGLAVLTRPIAAALPVIIGVVDWVRSARTTARPRQSHRWALLVGAAALVNLPWWVRNVVVLHRLILFASQAANPLVAGLKPGGASIQVPAGTNAYVFAIRYVLSALRSNPRAFLTWMTVGKWTLALSQPYAGGGPNGGFLQVLANYQVPLCWVGAAGLLWAAIFRPRLRVAAIAAATLAILLLGFIPTPRYADPLMALLAIGAGALLAGAAGAVVAGLRRLLRRPLTAR